jgi:tetratricopeptide (TPR) repeat protein
MADDGRGALPPDDEAAIDCDPLDEADRSDLLAHHRDRVANLQEQIRYLSYLNEQFAQSQASGRYREALAFIDLELAVWRELARNRPVAYMPSLAAALQDRARALSGLAGTFLDPRRRVRRREEALAAIDEAIVIWRQLPAALPQDSLLGLARALCTRSRVLTELRRRKAAEATLTEAVDIRRRLNELRPR